MYAHKRPEACTASTRVPFPSLAASGRGGPGVNVLLALQRSVGNAAFAEAIARARQAGEEEEADSVPAPLQHRPNVHDVLRSAERPLQAGMRAPATFESDAHPQPAHGGPSVQRSPNSWQNSEEVKKASSLSPGMGNSYWGPVLDAVKAYSGVDESDLQGRTQALSSVEQAIDAWRKNQTRGSSLFRRRQLSDGKIAAISGLEVLMIAERAEITRLTQARNRPSAPPPPSAPMAIPGARSRMPEGPSSDLDEEAQGTPVSPFPETSTPDAGAQRSLREAAPLPAGVTVYLHLTGEYNARKIHTGGIRPSRGRGGIGLADTSRSPDGSNFYVITGSVPDTTIAVSSEAGVRRVAVLSGPAVTYDRDVNYPAGGARRYFGDAPAAREQAGNEEVRGPISFVLPLRPGRTLQQVTRFVNARLGPSDAPLDEVEVAKRVHGHLLRTYNIMVVGHLAR
jgi:hypothetical protein